MKLKAMLCVGILAALAGCGDDGGGGGDDDKSASKDDFCGAFQSFYDDLQEVDGTEDNLGEILKKAAKKIEDVGTPEDIPEDAEDGLELTLDAIKDLPDDASAEDMAGIQEDFSEKDQEKADAFTAYLEKTCPDIGA